MESSLELPNLERASIEIEYATADFIHREATTIEPAEVRRLEVLISSLMGVIGALARASSERSASSPCIAERTTAAARASMSASVRLSGGR